MTSGAVTWYVARGGGVVAYVLVTLAVVAGITLAGKVRVPGLPRFAVEDVHRFLGLLAGTFVAVHVTGVALDATVPFSLSQLVVPFTASYRPLWTGLGVVALELLVALAVTNRLRRRLPYRVWRTLHGGTLVVWALATLHGVTAGTDRDQRWLLAVYAISVGVVVGSLALRLVARRAPEGGAFIAGCAAVTAVAVVFGLAHLPLQASPSRKAARVVTATSFSGPLKAAITTQDGDAARLLSVTGSAGTGLPVAFRIDLVTDGSAVTGSSLQIRYPASRGSTLCTGDISSIDDAGFSGTCSLPDGTTRTVQATWSITDGSVTGRLTSEA